jgi:hypothetical protein
MSKRVPDAQDLGAGGLMYEIVKKMIVNAEAIGTGL